MVQWVRGPINHCITGIQIAQIFLKKQHKHTKNPATMNGNTTLKIFQYAIIDISLSAWPYLQGIVISHLRTNDKAVLYQANHGQHISSLQLCLGMAESHIQENDRT